MDFLAQRLRLVKSSATLLINRTANELKRQGKNIISLAAGEPDFDTPDNIKQSAIRSIEAGFTKYTNTDGIVELKQAIQNKFKKDYSINYNLNQIIVTVGAKQALFNLILATVDYNDEVIIPVPYWSSYSDMVLMAGGKPVFINSLPEKNFSIDIESLEKSITQETKWIILNSPNNPSGAIYSAEHLQEIALILKKHPKIHVISDDIYEHIIFGNKKFVNILEVAPELVERTVLINGVSKSHAMTGWRIGFAAGPEYIIKSMMTIQSQSTSNPTSISQYAALEALNGPDDFVRGNKSVYQEKRDLAISIMQKIPGIKFNIPDGAFYLFLDCRELLLKSQQKQKTSLNSNQNRLIEDSVELAKFLLEEAEVAVVPGIAFGLEGYIRISYATSFKELGEACLRIKDALLKLLNS